MKKIIALLVLAVSLAGCGKDGQPKPVSSALAPATPPATLPAPDKGPNHWKPNDGGPVNFKANEAPDPAKYKGFKF